MGAEGGFTGHDIQVSPSKMKEMTKDKYKEIIKNKKGFFDVKI